MTEFILFFGFLFLCESLGEIRNVLREIAHNIRDIKPEKGGEK